MPHWQVGGSGKRAIIKEIVTAFNYKSKSLSSRMKKSVLIPQGKNEEC